jgi:hypothetical protein
VAESGGLENRCTFTGTVGSNPTLSAIPNYWRGRIMVLHRVGSAAGRKACAGSNPALSASQDLIFEV